MKAVIWIAVALLLIGGLSACVPTEPEDMLAYCKETYEQDFPNYPPAFVGACVAFLQTENPTALVSLCGSEAFRADLDAGLETRKDCIDFLRTYEE